MVVLRHHLGTLVFSSAIVTRSSSVPFSGPVFRSETAIEYTPSKISIKRRLNSLAFVLLKPQVYLFGRIRNQNERRPSSASTPSEGRSNMTNSNVMPSDEPPTGPRHFSLSLFQTNRDLVRPFILVKKIHSVLLGTFGGAQNAVRHIIHPIGRPVVTPSEDVCTTQHTTESKSLVAPKPFISDSQDVNRQLTARNNDPESESPPRTTVHNDNNHSPPEADNMEETSQTAASREHECIGKAAFISLFLFLIFLPGLNLGLATKRIEWAIAVSGAVTPAFVFFGGLYYNHNR